MVELIVELIVTMDCWPAIAAEEAQGVSVTVTVCAGAVTVTVAISDARSLAVLWSAAVTAVSRYEMNSDAA